MAKDPATNWYWNDWHGGTATMSRFLKGCYMDLLHAQHNNGRLSLEEIKTVLGADFGTSWPTLLKKFEKDENNLFFNVRAEQEKDKRSKFSQSRRDNIAKRYQKPTSVDTSVVDMKVLVENENDIGSKEGGMGETLETIRDFKPTVFLKRIGSEAASKAATESWDIEGGRWRYETSKTFGIKENDLREWMRQFNLSIAEKETDKFNGSSYRQMFRGWLRNQINEGKTLPKIIPLQQNNLTGNLKKLN